MSEIQDLEKYKSIFSTYQNSYKFALGLALANIVKDKNKISFLDIAKEVVGYYFNHHFKYKITETSNLGQKPEVITILETYIDTEYNGEYVKKLTNVDINILANCIINPKKLKDYGIYHDRMNNFKGYFFYPLPCWQQAEPNKKSGYNYFKQGENDFFMYDSLKEEIQIKDKYFYLINEGRDLLVDLTVAEWVKFAEKFNNLPKLFQKISLEKPKRTTSKFNGIFNDLSMLEKDICFICGKPITNKDERTLDHVIPFSYIFSCDLWNLVSAHKSCNCSKNDRIGSPRMIEKLIKRNIDLWNREESIPKKYHNIYYNSFRNNFTSSDEIKNKINKTVSDCKAVGFTQLNNRIIIPIKSSLRVPT